MYFIDYAVTVCLPFTPTLPCNSLPAASPTLSSCPWVVHINYLAFSISCAILNLPLSILYLPFMLFIPSTFSPVPLFSLPADNPPCDLHFCVSIPVLVVCSVHFWFCFLGSVVDSCEFVVILLFIVFYLFLR